MKTFGWYMYRRLIFNSVICSIILIAKLTPKLFVVQSVAGLFSELAFLMQKFLGKSFINQSK